ncbi:HAD family phosphatase [Candidatus Bathyarchaeota archaeon]|nr:HAD family phosphatase [Candidatus Bathyarchaeota archaeon]
MIKAIIFDWDGTLGDTKEAVIESFQKTLRKIGCNVTNKTIEKWVGIGTKNTFEKVFQECNLSFNELLIENLTIEKINIQLELTNRVNLFDGAIELLDELQGKIKIALATMSSRKVVDKLLFEKRINEYFDVVFSADEIQNAKPDPEIFLVTAKSLGVEPQNCIVVEDSVFGVRAAKGANMKCIGVASGAYNVKDLQKENPDIVVNSLNEKEKILDFIINNKR